MEYRGIHYSKPFSFVSFLSFLFSFLFSSGTSLSCKDPLMERPYLKPCTWEEGDLPVGTNGLPGSQTEWEFVQRIVHGHSSFWETAMEEILSNGNPGCLHSFFPQVS